MSNYNILLKMTGSIACYKSAALISKLMQNDFVVQVVVTDYALKFIGKATLEGLTGRPVLSDTFEDNHMMSHINLTKWADATILVPASANTINKIAHGISDNLVTTLFLAHDRSKPYLIVPAMNTKMYEHPSTQESLKQLAAWGLKVLSTADGFLACGDFGKGKMIEPDQIYSELVNALEARYEANKNKKVLITGGGTKENIDGIRFLSNLSTGKTASIIAQHFVDIGYEVTFIHSSDSLVPTGNFKSEVFTNFESLNNSLKTLLSSNSYDLVIHNAAVSDFTIKEAIVDDKSYKVPLTQKLPSNGSEVIFKLVPNFKIVDRIKEYSVNKGVKLVSFKFTNSADKSEQESKIFKLLSDSNSDIVIHNDLSARTENNVQKDFSLYGKDKSIISIKNSIDIAPKIIDQIFK